MFSTLSVVNLVIFEFSTRPEKNALGDGDATFLTPAEKNFKKKN
jgi:hypothetical protein